MNFKLFWLIHNERPYKRYYYQPRNLNHPNRPGWLWEIRCLLARYIKAAYLPFDPKFNTQQFPGSRKCKLQMLYESLKWCFCYKEICNYYFCMALT